MNRVTFTICCVLLLSSQAVGIAPIGPAASTLDQGRIKLGFDYTHTVFDGLPFDVTVGGKREENPIDDKINAYFARIGYGLVDPVDIFLRLGVANAELTETEFAWGLGGRFTFVRSERLDWGLIAQASWYSNDVETIRQDEIWGPVFYREDLNIRVIQIAAGPVYKGDRLSVYGGPFVFWSKGDGDLKVDYGLYSETYPIDVESDIAAGVYVGLSLAVKPNINLKAECQLAGHFRAFGGSLIYRF